MVPRTILVFGIGIFGLGLVAADSPNDLQPLMAVSDQVVLQDDFSETHPLKKGVWQARQGTRWEITDGVLRGQQSSPEYQAKKKDHFGYEPRLSIPVTPPEFIAKFSFRKKLQLVMRCR